MIVQADSAVDATRAIYGSLRIDVGPCLRMITARAESGTLLGILGFNTWLGGCVAAHIACQTEAFRPLFRAGLRYAFGELKLQAVLGFIDGSRERWVETHRRLGYREVGRIVGGALNGHDLVILELRPENCRMWHRLAKEYADG